MFTNFTIAYGLETIMSSEQIGQNLVRCNDQPLFDEIA